MMRPQILNHGKYKVPQERPSNKCEIMSEPSSFCSL